MKIFCELKKCIQNKTHCQTNEMLYHRRAKWGREDNIRWEFSSSRSRLPKFHKGGHNVPVDVVKRRYHRGWKNFLNHYKELVDTWVIFDNSGNIPRVVEEKPWEKNHIQNQPWMRCTGHQNRHLKKRQIWIWKYRSGKMGKLSLSIPGKNWKKWVISGLKVNYHMNLHGHEKQWISIQYLTWSYHEFDQRECIALLTQ